MDKKNILLLMPIYNYWFHLGVVKYAGQHDFSVSSFIGDITNENIQNREGVIIFYGDRKANYIRILKNCEIPTVHFGYKRFSKNEIIIHPDDEMIGEQGAEYLVKRGFRHIGFYMYENSLFLEKRKNSFRRLVEKHGREYYPILQDDIPDVIINIPKPAAIMALNDEVALSLIEACYNNNIKVPDEIAVLGAGNNPLICSAAPIPISSLHTGHENWGYESMRYLNKKINGEDFKNKNIKVPPGEIITRQSTDIMAIQNENVLNTLDFINENFTDSGLTIDDIARKIGISRRRLDKILKNSTGYTVYETLIRVRIKEANTQIKKARLKNYEVAEKAGFSSYLQMYRALKRWE